MKRRAQRCLFGRSNEQDREMERGKFEDKLRVIQEMKSIKYNFDFQLGVPRDGRYVWTQMPVRQQIYDNDCNNHYHNSDDEDANKNIPTPLTSRLQNDNELSLVMDYVTTDSSGNDARTPTEEGARQTHYSKREETLDKKTAEKCGISPETTPTQTLVSPHPKLRVFKKAVISKKNYADKRSSIPAFFKNKKARPSAT